MMDKLFVDTVVISHHEKLFKILYRILNMVYNIVYRLWLIGYSIILLAYPAHD